MESTRSHRIHPLVCVQLKDIEKFVRDHGSQLNLDSVTGELEGKVEATIGELRNVLKEAIPEGGNERRSCWRFNDTCAR